MPPKASGSKKKTNQVELKKLREAYKKAKTVGNAKNFIAGFIGGQVNTPKSDDYKTLLTIVEGQYEELKGEFSEHVFTVLSDLFSKLMKDKARQEICLLAATFGIIGVPAELVTKVGQVDDSDFSDDEKFYSKMTKLLLSKMPQASPVEVKKTVEAAKTRLLKQATLSFGVKKKPAEKAKNPASGRASSNSSDEFEALFKSYVCSDSFQTDKCLSEVLSLAAALPTLGEKVVELVNVLRSDGACRCQESLIEWLITHYKSTGRKKNAAELQENLDADERFQKALEALKRDNLPLAREQFKYAAVEMGKKKAFPYYAVMCYRGEGGPVDIEAAFAYASRLSMLDAVHIQADHLLDFGEIFHVMSFSQKTGAEKVKLETKASEYYEVVIGHSDVDDGGKERARLNLMILKPSADAEIPVDVEVSSSVDDSPAELLNFSCDTVDGRDSAIAFLVPRGDVEGEPTFQALKAYYKEGYNKYQLLTRYLSLARQDDQSGKKEVCKALLASMFDSDINFDDVEASYALLKKQETEASKYFDEDVSDDSDAEDAELYKASERHFHKRFPAKLSAKLKKVIGDSKKLLQTFEDEMSKDSFDSLKKKCDSAFSADLAEFHPKVDRVKDEIKTDAKSLCHGAEAQKHKHGNVENLALKLGRMGARAQHYYVAQTRGIHHDRRWDQLQRRKYRKHVREHQLQHRIYSQACYIHAGVRYEDFTDLAMRKLALSEKYVHYCMGKLHDSPYVEADLPTVADDFSAAEIKILSREMLTKKFSSKRDQIQQLYSNEYYVFHKFIAWEATQPEATFPNTRSPFVSSADYGTIAAFHYAVGNKYYDDGESRLRPRYSRDGRPARPYSGTVTLSLLSFNDLLQLHNHAPSMNYEARIQLKQRIFSERESTFVGSLPGEIVFACNIKFPDFTQPWTMSAYLKYGLDEELFALFKDRLSAYRNHSREQRLVIYFLGRYLSAFHSLLLQQEAVDWVSEKENGFLFFRTPEGGFSEKPPKNNDFNPSLHSDKDRTEVTDLRRSQRKRSAAEQALEDAAGPAEPPGTFASPKPTKQLKAESKQPQTEEQPPLSAKAKGKRRAKDQSGGGDELSDDESGSAFGSASSAMYGGYNAGRGSGYSDASGAGPAVPMEPG